MKKFILPGNIEYEGLLGTIAALFPEIEEQDMWIESDGRGKAVLVVCKEVCEDAVQAGINAWIIRGGGKTRAIKEKIFFKEKTQMTENKEKPEEQKPEPAQQAQAQQAQQAQGDDDDIELVFGNAGRIMKKIVESVQTNADAANDKICGLVKKAEGEVANIAETIAGDITAIKQDIAGIKDSDAKQQEAFAQYKKSTGGIFRQMSDAISTIEERVAKLEQRQAQHDARHHEFFDDVFASYNRLFPRVEEEETAVQDGAPATVPAEEEEE
jgi:hypothetical protein